MHRDSQLVLINSERSPATDFTPGEQLTTNGQLGGFIFREARSRLYKAHEVLQ
jgi:hypothetical protein